MLLNYISQTRKDPKVGVRANLTIQTFHFLDGIC
jgi:hypothetical protein